MPTALKYIDPDTLLNQSQVARLLGTTTKFMESRRCKGGGVPFIRVGRLVRYRPSDVRDWIESQRRLSTSNKPRPAA
jgi:hypothetical protein